MRSSNPAGALYSALAVSLPLFLLGSFIFFFAGLLELLVPSFSLPRAALLVPGLISGAAASLYYALMKNDLSDHTAGTIRGALAVMILAYPAASLLRPGLPLLLRFLPGAANLLAPLCALYVWAQGMSLKQLFRSRELLESYTENYRGEKLQQLMLADAVLFNALTDLIRKNRRLIITQTVLIFVLALIPPVLGRPQGIGGLVLLVILLPAAVCFCGLLDFFRQEHYYAGEGITAPAGDRIRRITGMGLFALAAAAGALLLAPGEAMLPFSLITGLLARLAAFFARLPRPPAGPPPPVEAFEIPASPLPALGPLMDLAEDTEPWPFWDWLKYGFFALAALLFLRFMLRPLFNRSRAGDSLGERLRRIIVEWFRNTLKAGAAFLAFLKKGNPRTGIIPDGASLRRLSGDLFAAYSQRKRREIRGSIGLFARLILWGGERRQVLWKPAHGPGEYCALLARTASPEPSPGPDAEAALSAGILRCGELFEKALYAPAPLSRSERTEFKRLVGEITG